MNEYNEKVDYMIYETSLARMERVNKRFFVMCIICFLAFVISNIMWLNYEFQFEDQSVTQEIDTGDGDANIIGIGDYYGESKADN